jgi:hypothetical protein
MKSKIKIDRDAVSPIIESHDSHGNGLMGFTIKHEDGTFQNIMQPFTFESKESVLAKLKIEQAKAIKQTSKKRKAKEK